MESPKGRYRMWQAIPFFILGLFGLYLLGTDWGNNHIPVWFMPIIKFLSASSIGIVTLYYGSRIITHDRTHEIPTIRRIERGNYQWIALSIVIAGALVASF